MVSNVAAFFVSGDSATVLVLLAYLGVGVSYLVLRRRLRRLAAAEKPAKADIAAHQETVHNLRTAKEEAERANLLKSIVFANMSHEIRTPLTAIIGYSDLLEKRLQGTDSHAFALTIRDGGRRLLNLLNGIIDLARIDSGKYTLTPAPYPLHASLDRVGSLLSLLAREKGLTLDIDIDKHLSVFADQQALEQIWTNLINNAIRFTKNGAIKIRATGGEEMVTITIEDTGIGIADWFLPHVFEEFRQESEQETGYQEGSGLGLPITKRLVERLGGTIEIKSTKGLGTLAVVRLPASAPVALKTEEAMVEVVLPQGKRILFVEDDPECGYLVSELLGPGNQVYWFQKPRPALEFARKNQVDLVLMDIHLREHGYDGRKLLQNLRLVDDYRNVPILAVTAYAIPGDRDRFIEEGFNGYIAKPFDLRDFGGVLRGIFETGAYRSLH